MYSNNDQLLYVISAKKEMSWPAFTEMADYLYMLQMQSHSLNMDSIPYRRRETVRAIDSLGHCDVEFNEYGGRIYAAPPLLARLPRAGLPEAILVGARSPQAIGHLSEAIKAFGWQVEIHLGEQLNDLMLVPSRVLVQAESTDQLAAIANKLGIAFEEQPPAWSLLHLSGSLDDYLATREWPASKELNWPRKDFDLSCLQFRDTRQDAAPVRLSSYSDRVRNIQIHFLWKGGFCAQVDRDWGRYAVFMEAGLNVLIYDQRRSIMAVPASAPLPRLLARALALCSGYAARFVPKQIVPYPSPERWGFRLFQDVPPQVAEIAATKVGQTLLPYSLDINLRGNNV